LTKVAIIILNYNGKRFLSDCIKSVLEQSYRDFRIYLVDNSSTDGSVEFVRKYFPEVEVIVNSDNLGFAAGNNAGFSRTINRHDYIVLLNNDTKVDKNWLKELLKPLETGESIGISTSLVLSWNGEHIDHAGGQILNLLGGWFGGYQPTRNPRPRRIFNVFYGSGCSLAIKSTVLKDVGLFDPSFFTYYEDVDLSWRCLLSGFKVVCNPRSIVFHLGSAPMSGPIYVSKPILEFHKEKNVFAVMFKNLSTMYLVLLFLPLLLTRLFFIFYRLRISTDVFRARISGLKYFFTHLPYYHQGRNRIQSRRKKQDREVFRSNPHPIFSIKGLKLTKRLQKIHARQRVIEEERI